MTLKKLYSNESKFKTRFDRLVSKYPVNGVVRKHIRKFPCLIQAVLLCYPEYSGQQWALKKIRQWIYKGNKKPTNWLEEKQCVFDCDI